MMAGDEFYDDDVTSGLLDEGATNAELNAELDPELDRRAAREHFVSFVDPDIICAECGHNGRGSVPGCPCLGCDAPAVVS